MHAEATASKLLDELQSSTWPDSTKVLGLLQELEMRRRWAIAQLARLPLEHAQEPQRRRCRTVFATLDHPQAAERLSAVDLGWRKLAAETAIGSPNKDAQATVELVFTRSNWRFLELLDDNDGHCVRFDTIGRRLKRHARKPDARQLAYKPTEEDVQHIRTLSVDWTSTIMRALRTAEALLEQVANLSGPESSPQYASSSSIFSSMSPELEMSSPPLRRFEPEEAQSTPRATRTLKRKRESTQDTPRAASAELMQPHEEISALQIDIGMEKKGHGAYTELSTQSTGQESVEVEFFVSEPPAAEQVMDYANEVDESSPPPATQPPIHTMPNSVLQKLRGGAIANKEQLQASEQQRTSAITFRVLEEPSEVSRIRPRPNVPESKSSQVNEQSRDVQQAEVRQAPQTSVLPDMAKESDGLENEAERHNVKAPVSSDDDAQKVVSTSQTTAFPPAAQAVTIDTTDTSATSGTSQSQNSSGVLVPNTQSTSGNVSSSHVAATANVNGRPGNVVLGAVNDSQTQTFSSNESNSFSLEYLSKEETAQTERKMEQEQSKAVLPLTEPVATLSGPEPVEPVVNDAADAAYEVLSQEAIVEDDKDQDLESFSHMIPAKNAAVSFKLQTEPPTPGSPGILSQALEPPPSPQFHTQAVDLSPMLDASQPKSFGQVQQEADDSISDLNSFGHIDSD
ncbi:hypothetical protein OIV83_006384 [Microbotryomycetes sp. JL201]|nr:hypothetical protein OIV83_006384 [Microbotryomycetes sp. JL201]